VRSRTAGFTSMALGLLAAIGPATGASAYWTAEGSGTASATTGNLGSPTGVTASQPTSGATTVRVTWTAPGPPSVAPAGYYVQRFAGATASPACGSSPTSLLPATPTACDDTGVAPGTYSYKVVAVLNSWTATSASSASVTVTIVAAPATKLAFTVQPASGANVQATGTGTFSASVAVQDASGNVRTTDNTTLVTLAIGTNPSAGVLACTNGGGVGPVFVTNGLANFTGCSITKVGIGYTLTATSSPALTAPVNANSFNITAGRAAGIVISSITTSPTPALGAPTGVVGALAYSSVGQAINTGNVLTARISLADQNHNLVVNGTGSTITVGLSVAGSGTVSPSTLSIANGASTSSASFTLTRSTGGGKTVTLTATVAGTTQRLTVVMASS